MIERLMWYLIAGAIGVSLLIIYWLFTGNCIEKKEPIFKQILLLVLVFIVGCVMPMFSIPLGITATIQGIGQLFGHDIFDIGTSDESDSDSDN